MDHKIRLFLLCLIVLGFRLVLAGSTPYLYGDESYLHMREVETLRHEGRLPDIDPLRDQPHSSSPLFAYILTFFTYFLPPIAVYKIIPNLFATSLVVITYLIAYTITRSHHCSLLTAALSGFIPVFVAETYNQLSVYSIALPLLGLLVYSYLHLKDRLLLYITTLVLYTFLHPSIVIFAIGLLFYTLFCTIEGIAIPEEEREAILFSIVFVTLSQVILYRNVLLTLGTTFLSQNIPTHLLSTYFQSFSILDTIYKIDAVPFLFGLYTMRQYLFKINDRTMYFLISFAFALGIILFQKLLPLTEALMFFGVVMVFLFPKSYQYRLQLIARTRAGSHINRWKLFLFVFFLSTAVISSLHLALAQPERTTLTDEYAALSWLQNETGNNTIILSDLSDSEKIRAIARRNIILDSDFLLTDDANQRYDDIRTVFTSPYLTQVAERLDHYHVDYVYVSPATRARYNITTLPAATEECLPLKYNTTVQIYAWRCALEDTR